MKKQLLGTILASLLVFGLAGVANAETPTASSTVTATNPTIFNVTGTTNYATNIDPSNGSLDSLVPTFQIQSNKNGYKIHVSAATAGSVNLMNAGTGAGNVKIALAKSDALESSITNALSSTPTAASNPDVVTYSVDLAATNGATFGTFNGTDVFADAPNSGTTDMTITFGSVISGTHGQYSDTSGDYNATITCTASNT